MTEPILQIYIDEEAGIIHNVPLKIVARLKGGKLDANDYIPCHSTITERKRYLISNEDI